MAFSRVFPVLAVMSFCDSLVFFAPAAILVRTRCGISVSDFFVLQAVLSLGVFALEVPCGFLTDRIGYKKSIVLSQVIFLASRFMLFLGGSFAFFVAEAVLEALSASLASGTEDAYLYSACSGNEDEFVKRGAVLGNFGEAAFIASTLLFAPMNHFFALDGLLLATIFSSFVAFFTSLFIPDERKFTRALEVESKPQLSLSATFKQIPKFPCFAIFAFSSVIAVAGIAVNFLYILKIQSIGLDEEWMSALILGYTALNMLTPLALSLSKRLGKRTVVCVFLAAASVLSFSIAFCSSIYALAPMLLLPLSLSVVSAVFSGIVNRFVDSVGMQKNRAAVLSVFNQGSNALQVAFLFAASSFDKFSSVNLFALLSATLLLCALFVKMKGKN